MRKIDVTDKVVNWGVVDDEVLYPFDCPACGAPMGHISICDDDPKGCPACGRAYCFSNRITVWEVVVE